MSAADLLACFSRRDIQLRAEHERLIYDAPAGQLQASDLEKLTEPQVRTAGVSEP